MPVVEPCYLRLNQLFSERAFKIPRYQRYYSWQRKQVQDLCDDIYRLHSRDASKNQDHFMATIVCYWTVNFDRVVGKSYSSCEIVDGQQRITTLALLLRVIANKVGDASQQDKILAMLIKDDHVVLVFQTNNDNKRFLNSYLRSGIRPNKDDLENDADENLICAIETLEKFCDSWIAENLNIDLLLDLVINRLGFIVCDTTDKLTVYTIFESLNSRGLPVDWLDKTKSMLMGIACRSCLSATAPENRISELHDLWAKIYALLSRDALKSQSVPDEDILRIAATLHRSGISGKALTSEESIAEFREYCELSEQRIVDVSNWILSVVESLTKLMNRKALKTVMEISHVRLLGVAIMLNPLLSDVERALALEQWERVSFRIFKLYGKDSRSEVGHYVRLACELGPKSEHSLSALQILESLVSLGGDYPILEGVAELIRHPRYEGFEEECRYILWRYEEYLASSENGIVDPKLEVEIWNERAASQTIEHIMPQSWADKSKWKGSLHQGQHLAREVDRLGNLLLLPRGFNSEAGNKNFSDKKPVYKRAISLRIVAEVYRSRFWDENHIIAREKHIAKFLTKRFKDVEIIGLRPAATLAIPGIN